MGGKGAKNVAGEAKAWETIGNTIKKAKLIVRIPRDLIAKIFALRQVWEVWEERKDVIPAMHWARLVVQV